MATASTASIPKLFVLTSHLRGAFPGFSTGVQSAHKLNAMPGLGRYEWLYTTIPGSGQSSGQGQSFEPDCQEILVAGVGEETGERAQAGFQAKAVGTGLGGQLKHYFKDVGSAPIEKALLVFDWESGKAVVGMGLVHICMAGG